MTTPTEGIAAVPVLHALRHPRGRYAADRAAQLSGIPRSTLYDWQRADVYVPDFAGGSPMAWSYRDLVFVRVLAWLRNDIKTPRPTAAARVRSLKHHISAGKSVTVLNADRDTLAVDGDVTAPLEGSSRLFSDMLQSFDLTAAIEDFGRHAKLWGPNLVTPSAHTFISPWVLGGDPCVERTRIQSASIYSLRTERGLTSEEIVNLYPGLQVPAADDAYALKSRLRGTDELAAA
ncbi:MAG: DUF433 domain-containing protein [Ilumatobacteraceae bacterium]